MFKSFAILMLLAALGTGCSWQSRTATPTVNSAELNTLLEQILGDLSPSAQAEAENLIYNPTNGVDYATIFYGEGCAQSAQSECNSAMGSPGSVFAFEWLDFVERDLNYKYLLEARVIFLSDPLTERFSLIVDVTLNEEGENIFGRQTITKYYTQVPNRISDPVYTQDDLALSDTFQITLENEETGELIMLKSHDLDLNSTEFNKVIQLKVYYQPPGANEMIYEGKFSSLVAFE